MGARFHAFVAFPGAPHRVVDFLRDMHAPACPTLRRVAGELQYIERPGTPEQAASLIREIERCWSDPQMGWFPIDTKGLLFFVFRHCICISHATRWIWFANNDYPQDPHTILRDTLCDACCDVAYYFGGHEVLYLSDSTPLGEGASERARLGASFAEIRDWVMKEEGPPSSDRWQTNDFAYAYDTFDPATIRSD